LQPSKEKVQIVIERISEKVAEILKLKEKDDKKNSKDKIIRNFYRSLDQRSFFYNNSELQFCGSKGKSNQISFRN